MTQDTSPATPSFSAWRLSPRFVQQCDVQTKLEVRTDLRIRDGQILWGPLSYIVAGLIIADHPLRFPLQAVVSVGQLYGDVLYYATSMFDLYYKGLNYCRPEPYYFWVYFFTMNFIWIVIPSGECWRDLQERMRRLTFDVHQ